MINKAKEYYRIVEFFKENPEVMSGSTYMELPLSTASWGTMDIVAFDFETDITGYDNQTSYVSYRKGSDLDIELQGTLECITIPCNEYENFICTEEMVFQYSTMYSTEIIEIISMFSYFHQNNCPDFYLDTNPELIHKLQEFIEYNETTKKL